jgi:hypothetical protein
MKPFLTFLLCTTLCKLSIAQAITANDSVSIGAGNSQMVFYKLSDGTKTTSSNADWHLALTVRATQFPNAPLGGTTIRINEANGVKAIYVPNADAAGFSTLDTTGWQSWRKLHDSDTAIDEGALNSNRGSNIFDFGWGTYNSGTHNVTGDSLYLLQLPSGELKKFLVVDLDKDTAFNLKYANIDNSDLQTLKISKKDYQGKQFVYLNLLTNAVHDKEPLASAWDLQFLKYAANDVLPDTAYGVVGVWANKNAKVAEARSVDVTLNNYQAYTFSDNLNAIGWDWKSFNNQTFQYEIEDSLAYFVQTLGGAVYKVIFTGYSGSSTGVISFYTEPVSGTTGVEITEVPAVALFPNPSSNYVNIAVEQNENLRSVVITDMSGRVLVNATAGGTFHTINTIDLPNGFYLATINLGGQTVAKRFVVSR